MPTTGNSYGAKKPGIVTSQCHDPHRMSRFVIAQRQPVRLLGDTKRPVTTANGRRRVRARHRAVVFELRHAAPGFLLA
jgi:hypothetical protein